MSFFTFSLTCGTGLKILKIRLTLGHAQLEGHVPPDQVFLSKVSGILALKKLAANGVHVGFECGEREISGKLILLHAVGNTT